MVTRAIARKLSIQTIVNAPYVSGNDIEHPNHLLINGEKIIRVNTLGRIKEKYENPEANYSSLIIEDKGSQLKIKFFEFVELNGFKEGDLIKAIGKIRQQNQEKYLLGEVIKKVSEKYKQDREKELFTTQTVFKNQEQEDNKVQMTKQKEEKQEHEIDKIKNQKEVQKQNQEAIIEDLGDVSE